MEMDDMIREMVKKWKKRYDEDLKEYEKLPIQLAEEVAEDVFVSSARLNYWRTRLELAKLFNKKTKEG